MECFWSLFYHLCVKIVAFRDGLSCCLPQRLKSLHWRLRVQGAWTGSDKAHWELPRNLWQFSLWKSDETTFEATPCYTSTYFCCLSACSACCLLVSYVVVVFWWTKPPPNFRDTEALPDGRAFCCKLRFRGALGDSCGGWWYSIYSCGIHWKFGGNSLESERNKIGFTDIYLLMIGDFPC